MKARQVALVVGLAAAVTLTSVAAASADAARQRVEITSNLYPRREFVLAPLQAGPLKRDSGSARIVYMTWGRRVHNGQDVEILRAYFAFEGKRGTLTIRERTEWLDAGDGAGGPSIATGTWKVVRGTGQYAKIAGGGRSAHSGLGGTNPWYARQEGFFTHP